MADRILSKRYAKALFSLTDSKNTCEALMSLAGLLTANPELSAFVMNPAFPVSARVNVLCRIMGIDGGTPDSGAPDSGTQDNGAPDSGVSAGGAGNGYLRGFLELLGKKGRLALIPEVSTEYKTLRDGANNVLRITVKSPYPLDDAELGCIREKYKRQNGAAKTYVVNEVIPSLVGGIMVEADGRRTDDSVNGRLAALADSIAAAFGDCG